MRISLLLFVLISVSRPVGAQASPSLHDLAFMSGCWEGSFGAGGVIEERYTTPSDNVLLGTTRYLMGSEAVQFELTAIRAASDGTVELHPYPGGSRSDHAFRLTSVTGGEAPSAVFVAPENDFPQRIVYRRVAGSPTVLVARIDNGEASPEAQEWRMTAVVCEGGPPSQ